MFKQTKTRLITSKKLKKMWKVMSLSIMLMLVVNMSYLGVFFVVKEAKANANIGTIVLVSIEKVIDNKYLVSGTWSWQGEQCKNKLYHIGIARNPSSMNRDDLRDAVIYTIKEPACVSDWSAEISLLAGNNQICAVLLHGNPGQGNDLAYSCRSYDNSEPINPVCGNGKIEQDEQCDDGNTTSGDGCSATCQWEDWDTPCDLPSGSDWFWSSPETYLQTCKVQDTNESGLYCSDWDPKLETKYIDGSGNACQYSCNKGYVWQESSDQCVEDQFNRWAEITSPHANQVVSGTVDLTATLYDKDGDDDVQWAVRKGTCDPGVNTVYGNVDGFDHLFSWDHYSFSSSVDTSGWENGEYCFIFNPTESLGDKPIRETQWFTVDNSNGSGDEESCGDGVCSENESCESCPADCGECSENPPVEGGGNSSSSGGGGGGGFISFALTNTQVAMQCVNGKVDMTVTWLSTYPANSRVVYDTTSHGGGSLGVAPNYGYAFTSALSETQVTGHSVSLTGLEPSTFYYFRPISVYNFSEVVGEEKPLTQTLSCAPGEESEVIVLGEEGAPELGLTSELLVSFVNPGSKGIDLKLTVTNNGELPSFDTTLSNILPDGFTYSDIGGKEWSWLLGDIEPGETKTIIVKVDVASDVNPATYLSNASVSSANHDVVSASTVIEVRQIAVLAETGFSVIEFGLLLSLLASFWGASYFLKKKAVNIKA